MAVPKRDGAKKPTAKARIQSLQDENEKLNSTIDRLKKINAEQVQRLTEQELLRVRIRELEQQLNRNADD